VEGLSVLQRSLKEKIFQRRKGFTVTKVPWPFLLIRMRRVFTLSGHSKKKTHATLAADSDRRKGFARTVGGHLWSFYRQRGLGRGKTWGCEEVFRHRNFQFCNSHGGGADGFNHIPICIVLGQSVQMKLASRLIATREPKI